LGERESIYLNQLIELINISSQFVNLLVISDKIEEKLNSERLERNDRCLECLVFCSILITLMVTRSEVVQADGSWIDEFLD
jgi:hypothetical protein